jgi:hypothetical protein
VRDGSATAIAAVLPLLLTGFGCSVVVRLLRRPASGRDDDDLLWQDICLALALEALTLRLRIVGVVGSLWAGITVLGGTQPLTVHVAVGLLLMLTIVCGALAIPMQKDAPAAWKARVLARVGAAG